MNLKTLLRTPKEIREEYSRIQAETKQLYAKSIWRQYTDIYVKACENNKVQDNVVLYESFWGRGIVDNPHAIFSYLLSEPKYSHLKHVWVLDDFEANQRIIKKYKKFSNVSFVMYESKEYLETLATAKYLINNVTFKPYFVKRDEQVYINTWHGTPLKSMGYEQVGGNLTSNNMVRNFLLADYLISANETMTNMYLDSYKLRGLYPGKIIEDGYPRNDFLFQTDKAEFLKELEAEGIHVDPNKKIILYAPTWREASSNVAVVNPDEFIEFKNCIEKHINSDEYQLLIKPHQYVYQQLKHMDEYKNMFIPATIDANQLMSIVDVMVSDYSSIFLDYLATGKPVVFYIPDLETYRAVRGLKIGVEDLPGFASSELEEVAEFLGDIDTRQKEYEEKYADVKEKIAKYDNGEVTKRLADLVFEGSFSGKSITTSSKKPKLLLSSAKMLDNGITNSFLNLLSMIDYDKFDVTVYLTQDSRKNAALDARVENLRKEIRVLLRKGPISASLDEEIRREFCIYLSREKTKKFVDRIYPHQVSKREFKRAFGFAEFDYIVEFNGYSPINASMFSAGNAIHKCIWLHNDIKADMNRTVNGKKPLLRNMNYVTSIYNKFDRLVSCGESVMEVNKKKLGASDTKDKFTYAKNIVDIERIENCIKDDSVFEMNGKKYWPNENIPSEVNAYSMDLVELPSDDEISFVSCGRLSTEKNHTSLIKAFRKFHKETPKSKLYIVGEGPLRPNLEAEIKEYGLEDSVILTGIVRNPFAIMRRCNCFVLPSHHEGLPMVLLEARSCGLPIIVSDFSTVSSSLYPDGQLLIKQTPESIYNALCEFRDGNIPVCNFDLEQYNKEAYEEFENAIL